MGEGDFRGECRVFRAFRNGIGFRISKKNESNGSLTPQLSCISIESGLEFAPCHSAICGVVCHKGVGDMARYRGPRVKKMRALGLKLPGLVQKILKTVHTG